MDFPPFIDGISDIQQTQAMTGSRTTMNAFSPRNYELLRGLTIDDYLPSRTNNKNENNQLQQQSQSQTNPSYASLRDYAQKTLGSWGLKIGYMPENYQNKLTINCFMQLIQQRFKDQQNRQQLKKALAQSSFQRNKYQSLYEQQKLNSAQKNRVIGRLQNTLNDFKNKIKFVQQTTKKQKEQDKKIICMLKSKNQQILHQIKKRQQQTNKIKEQLKKNIGEKNLFKNCTFEVFEVLKKQQNNQFSDKIGSVTQKYENQRKLIMRQNLLLRQKLYDIREEIVSFAEWIDMNVFKQENPSYKNKFLINHNLLFKKQSIVDQFNQILSDAKSGIKQIIQMHEENRKTMLKKKAQKIETNGNKDKNYEQNRSPNKLTIQNMGMKKIQSRQRQSMPLLSKRATTTNEKKAQKGKIAQPMFKKKSTSIQPDIEIDDCESQLSIISHLSTKQIVAQNNKFDKWDLLFNNQ